MEFIIPASRHHSPPSFASDASDTAPSTTPSIDQCRPSTQVCTANNTENKGMPDQPSGMPADGLTSTCPHRQQPESVSLTTLQQLPLELLAEILSSLPSAHLVSIMTINKRFQAVVCYILRLRLTHTQHFEEHKLLMECGPPSDVSWIVPCHYQETRGGGEDDGFSHRLEDLYFVFQVAARYARDNSIDYIPEMQPFKRSITLSNFETFGQFTISLRLRLAPSQFVVTPNMRDRPLRLQREWLETGESRISWLDDEEHIGIRLRARQANDSLQDQAVDAEENIWDVYVEELLYRAVPFLVEVEWAQAFKTSQTVLHLRS